MTNDYADDGRKLGRAIDYTQTVEQRIIAAQRSRLGLRITPAYRDEVKNVQAVMEQIKSSALTVPMVEGTLAQQDFKPALIVDSVSFADNWGDAR